MLAFINRFGSRKVGIVLFMLTVLYGYDRKNDERVESVINFNLIWQELKISFFFGEVKKLLYISNVNYYTMFQTIVSIKHKINFVRQSVEIICFSS